MANAKAPTNLDVWKTRVEIVSSVVTVFGAIAAAWWALHEYNGRQEQAHIETTLAYRKQYDSDPIFAARKVVDSAWLGVDTESAALRNNSDWTEYSNLVARLALQPEYRLSLTTLIDFYSEVYVCMRDNICDLNTTLDLFGKDALTYRNANYPFLESERARRNYTLFGCGLDETGKLYAARSKSPKPSQAPGLTFANCF